MKISIKYVWVDRFVTVLACVAAAVSVSLAYWSLALYILGEAL